MSRWTLPLVAALGGLLGICGLLWGQAWGVVGGVPTADRTRIERVVHDYILAHPEILPEAMQKLQDRETADRGRNAALVADANRKAIETPFASAWAGNPAGDVTLVEYFDYNCGYCRATLPTVAALLKRDPKVRIVYREFPILAQSSVDAARMSLAAAEQGKFAGFHEALYAGGPVTMQSIAAAARTAGLDAARAAAFAPRAQAEIAANEAMARQLGLTGTPSWVIGRKVVSSALPLEELQKAVAAARAGK